MITQLSGGAGVMAVRGARGVVGLTSITGTIITGPGADRRLVADAERAGLAVIVEPALCRPITPATDAVAVRRLTRLLAGFDVVHTHCAKAGVVARLAARRAGVPRVVHTYHGFPFHRFQSPARRAAYVWAERLLGRWCTDVALAVGAGVAAEAIRRHLVPVDRLRTIGVAVDHDAPVRTATGRARAREALNLPEDAIVIGAVGRLAYQKAPEDFVAALHRIRRPNIVGLWIGGGTPPAVDHAPDGETRVRFVGDRPNVPDLLPALDIFALPSRYEGLPLAIVEAMVCGVPVVATAVNAVPDVVVPGETGLLVPPGRPDRFAAAIEYLLDHPATAERFALTARRKIAGRHDENSLAASLCEAYSGRTPGSALITRSVRVTGST